MSEGELHIFIDIGSYPMLGSSPFSAGMIVIFDQQDRLDARYRRPGSRCRKAHGAAPAQYVGDQHQDSGVVDYHRRRQMGRDNIPADPLYQHLLLTAEKKFWQCVEIGETPHLFGVESPRPRVEAVRIVEMGSSNAWAEFAESFRRTRPAFLEHEKTKAELKSLMPEDAKEAAGHGVRAKRSKSGAVSFDLRDMEAKDAALQ